MEQLKPTPLPQALRRSEFDGTTLQLIGWRLLGGLITLLTLGIAYPWAACMLWRWEACHTKVEGKRLYFDGRGGQLMGKYILWYLLTLLTLGIYGLFLPVQLLKWRYAHTRFATESDYLASSDGVNPAGVSTKQIVLWVCIIAALLAALGTVIWLFIGFGTSSDAVNKTFTSDQLMAEATEATDPPPTQTEAPTAPPETDPPAPAEVWYVTASSLRLREDHNTNALQLESIPYGTALEVTQWVGNWAKVTYNGQTGWCSGDYLDTQAPGNG